MWLVPTCFQENFRHINQVPIPQNKIACFGYVLSYFREIAMKKCQMLQMYSYSSYLKDIKIWL